MNKFSNFSRTYMKSLSVINLIQTLISLTKVEIFLYLVLRFVCPSGCRQNVVIPIFSSL